MMIMLVVDVVIVVVIDVVAVYMFSFCIKQISDLKRGLQLRVETTTTKMMMVVVVDVIIVVVDVVIVVVDVVIVVVVYMFSFCIKNCPEGGAPTPK